MSRAQNGFVKAWKLFWKQARPAVKDKVLYVGEDHLGNKYYEANKPNHMKRPVHRYFERSKVESFEDVVDAAHVPPAWDAWLRFRRDRPPSLEEVMEGEEYFKMQQEMAAKKKAAKESSDASKAKSSKTGSSSTNTGDTKTQEIPPGFYDR